MHSFQAKQRFLNAEEYEKSMHIVHLRLIKPFRFCILQLSGKISDDFNHHGFTAELLESPDRHDRHSPALLSTVKPLHGAYP